MSNKIKKKTNCIFCSLGCPMLFEIEEDNAQAIYFDSDDPITHGSICPRGNYLFELLNNDERLTDPCLVNCGEYKKSSWEECLDYLSQGIKKIIEESGPESIGIIVNPNTTTENLEACAKLAQNIGTPNFQISGISLCEDILPADKEPQIKDVADFDALLIVGDLLSRSPVMSKYVNSVKYKKRGNRIIVIDSLPTHTSWFATDFLEIAPGTESLALLAIAKIINQEKINIENIAEILNIPAGKLKSAAETFRASNKAAIILASCFDNPKIEIAGQLLAAKENRYCISFKENGNALGAKEVLAKYPNNNVVDLLKNNKLNCLLVFGEDPLRSWPSKELFDGFKNLKLAVSIDMFKNISSKYSNMFLPASSYLEDGGTIKFNKNHEAKLEPLIHSIGQSKSYLEITKLLCRSEFEFAPAGIVSSMKPANEILKEIEILPLPQPGENYPFIAIAIEDINHIASGALSSNFGWAKANSKYAWVIINAEDAREMNIKEGETILLKSKNSEGLAKAVFSNKIKPKNLGLAHHFPEIRKLFSDLEKSFEEVRVNKR